MGTPKLVKGKPKHAPDPAWRYCLGPGCPRHLFYSTDKCDRFCAKARRRVAEANVSPRMLSPMKTPQEM